jgi:hypothetical protein
MNILGGINSRFGAKKWRKENKKAVNVFRWEEEICKSTSDIGYMLCRQYKGLIQRWSGLSPLNKTLKNHICQNVKGIITM